MPAGPLRMLRPMLALTAALACASAADAATPCQALAYEGGSYTACEVDLRRETVRVFWKKPDGEPYGHLSSLPRALGTGSAQKLVFAINGGMYHPDYRPVGLYVENGREFARANTRSGPGNFHMKPNGVFYVAGEAAGVAETGSFLKQRPAVEFATQSGPMLVINGRLHPRFAQSGGSRKFRSGVGTRDDNTLVFVVSDSEVSFGEFARLFRDRLKCTNALFLDGGSVPSLYAPALGRSGNLLPLGPMIAVYERGK